VEHRVELGEVAAPGGHRLRPVDLERLEPEVEHPLRLLLVCRDLTDDLLAQPPLRLEDRLVLRVEAVLVLVHTETLDRFVLRHGSSLDSVCRRRWVASGRPSAGGYGRLAAVPAEGCRSTPRSGRPRPKGFSQTVVAGSPRYSSYPFSSSSSASSGP